MSYKNINTSQIAPGKFVTSAQGLAWSNNPKAIAEADDSGNIAPRILCRASGTSAIAAPGGSSGQILRVTSETGPDGNLVVRPGNALEVGQQQRMIAQIVRGKSGGTTEGVATTGFLGSTGVSFNGLNQCPYVVTGWGYAPGELLTNLAMISDDTGRDNVEWWYANFTKITSDATNIYMHFITWSSGYTYSPPSSPLVFPKNGTEVSFTTLQNTPADPAGSKIELRGYTNAGRPNLKFIADADSVNDIAFGSVHFNYVQLSG